MVVVYALLKKIIINYRINFLYIFFDQTYDDFFRGDQSDEQGEGPDQRDFTMRQTTTFEKKTIQI